MGRRATLPGPGLIESARLLPSTIATPAVALEQLHRRHGPVVALGRGPFAYVCVFGPEAHQLLMADRPESFRWGEALQPLVAVDGPTALVVSDGDDHRRRRRLVQPAFGIRRVEGYLPIVVDEVGRTIDGWTPGATVDVAEDLRRTVRRIVIRSLFGDRLRDLADEIGDQLEAAIAYVNRSPITRFDHDWPGTPYRRAMKARRAVDEIVFAEIEARRAAPSDQGDVLSALIAAQEDGEQPLTDEEVRDQVVSLIAAGYDTTTAGVAWTVHAAFSDPGVRDRARAEVEAVVGDGPLTIDLLGSLPYLAGVVSESLRLWPPGAFGGRYVVEDVAFAGHVIPAGTTVVFSQYVAHRDPEHWPDPLRFDPERWVEGSPTFREPAPYTYLPFGGGYRRCIGFALATMEIKVILAELLRRVELTVLDPTPTPTGIATLSPEGGIRARVRPRPSSGGQPTRAD
jgi:cytochrome P450